MGAILENKFFLHDLEGAKPVLSVVRDYPYKDNYTHILGYVSEASVKDLNENENVKKNHVPGLRVGKSGLEKALENDLIGTNSVQRYEVNAYGKRINQIDHVEGIKGKKIRLTIDTEVQKYANELMAGKAGSISVMDIYTGELIALHSSPTFDQIYSTWHRFRRMEKNNTRSVKTINEQINFRIIFPRIYHKANSCSFCFRK